MAAPNLFVPNACTPQYDKVMPAGTSLTQLGSSPASGHVFKINTLLAANVTGSAATATVSIYPNTTPTGTPTRLVYQLAVPANSTLVVIDKNMMLYLPESYSIGVTSGTGAALEYSMGSEDLS